MAWVNISVLAIITALHLIAFVFIIGAEHRRSKATLVPDEYDEMEYCVYTKDASTVYGMSAFVLLLISHVLVNGVTRCLCCGKGLVRGTSSACAKFFFVFSWISFLANEACLLAGSARNAYHTKYRATFHFEHLSCATLHKGVFAAAAALTSLSLLGSIIYYWAHSRADTGGWEKHQNEGLRMADSNYSHNQQQGGEFDEALQVLQL